MSSTRVNRANRTPTQKRIISCGKRFWTCVKPERPREKTSGGTGLPCVCHGPAKTGSRYDKTVTHPCRNYCIDWLLALELRSCRIASRCSIVWYVSSSARDCSIDVRFSNDRLINTVSCSSSSPTLIKCIAVGGDDRNRMEHEFSLYRVSIDTQK